MSQSTPQTNACPGVPAVFPDQKTNVYVDLYSRDPVQSNWKSKFYCAFRDVCRKRCVTELYSDLEYWMRRSENDFSYRFIYRGAYVTKPGYLKEVWETLKTHEDMEDCDIVVSDDTNLNGELFPVNISTGKRKDAPLDLYDVHNVESTAQHLKTQLYRQELKQKQVATPETKVATPKPKVATLKPKVATQEQKVATQEQKVATPQPPLATPEQKQVDTRTGVLQNGLVWERSGSILWLRNPERLENTEPRNTILENIRDDETLVNEEKYTYGLAKSMDALLHYIYENRNSPKQYLNEVLPDDKLCFYADLDCENRDFVPENWHSKFLEIFSSGLANIGLEFDENLCFFTHSYKTGTNTPTNKFSVHFVYKGCYTVGGTAQKEFWVNLFADKEEWWYLNEKNMRKCIVDEKVYRYYGLMRYIYNEKEKKYNRLYPVTFDDQSNPTKIGLNTIDEFKNYIIRIVPDNAQEHKTTKKRKGENTNQKKKRQKTEKASVKSVDQCETDDEKRKAILSLWDEIVSICNDKIPDYELYQDDIKGAMIVLKAHGPRTCAFDVEHDSNNAFLLVKNDGLYFGCHGCGSEKTVLLSKFTDINVRKRIYAGRKWVFNDFRLFENPDGLHTIADIDDYLTSPDVFIRCGTTNQYVTFDDLQRPDKPIVYTEHPFAKKPKIFFFRHYDDGLTNIISMNVAQKGILGPTQGGFAGIREFIEKDESGLVVSRVCLDPAKRCTYALVYKMHNVNWIESVPYLRKPPLNTTSYNIFSPFPLAATLDTFKPSPKTDAKVQLLLDYLFEVICHSKSEWDRRHDPSVTEPRQKFNFLIFWAAYKLQYPHIKTCVMPLFQGLDGGTGKSIIGLLFKLLVGNDHFSLVKIEELLDKFNFDVFEDKSIIQIDEMDAEMKESVKNDLKRKITQENLRVSQKFQDPRYIKCYYDFIGNQNGLCEQVDSDGNRRMVYMEPNTEFQNHPRHKEYIDLLADPENGPAIFHYFATLPLGDWIPRDNLPKTRLGVSTTLLSKNNFPYFHLLLVSLGVRQPGLSQAFAKEQGVIPFLQYDDDTKEQDEQWVIPSTFCYEKSKVYEDYVRLCKEFAVAPIGNEYKNNVPKTVGGDFAPKNPRKFQKQEYPYYRISYSDMERCVRKKIGNLSDENFNMLAFLREEIHQLQIPLSVKFRDTGLCLWANNSLNGLIFSIEGKPKDELIGDGDKDKGDSKKTQACESREVVNLRKNIHGFK